jgi:hypothetical protein
MFEFANAIHRENICATLWKMGIQPEATNVLQGRVSRSIFVRHYFTPVSDYKAKVLQAVHQLQKEI